MLELLFNGAPISLSTILRGYLNMLEGNSWAHMWYVYLLISLYIITPALKAMIKGLSKRQFELLAASLVVGHIGVDTINDIFHTQLYGYMQFSRYLMYYLIGYYVTQYVIANMEQKRSQWLTGCAVTLVLSSVMRYGLVLGSVLKTGELSLLGFDSGILEFMQVLSLFCLVCLLCSTKTALPSVCRNLARCSFSIYLVHPVFINLFYKAAGITPQVFPICIGIMVMLLVFFALSWVTANVMVRIPILKKIL